MSHPMVTLQRSLMLIKAQSLWHGALPLPATCCSAGAPERAQAGSTSACPRWDCLNLTLCYDRTCPPGKRCSRASCSLCKLAYWQGTHAGDLRLITRITLKTRSSARMFRQVPSSRQLSFLAAFAKTFARACSYLNWATDFSHSTSRTDKKFLPALKLHSFIRPVPSV